MPNRPSTAPDPGTYPARLENYIRKTPSGDILVTLDEQLREVLGLVRSFSEERSLHRYTDGKWSVREVVGHITDTERVFSYRLLRIARGDQTPLPSFDQDQFAAGAESDRVPLAALLEEFGHVRRATLALIETLPDAAWDRQTVVGGTPVNAHAMAWAIVGHAAHHLEILKERY